MPKAIVCRGVVFSLLLLALWKTPVSAQIATGYRPIEEPGIYGARIHPGALAPNLRKWYFPQNLYYEYGWRAWEYSNYARDFYQRYVNILLEGTRHYDPFGYYIARGWKVYDWTEASPQRIGSSIFKSPFYGQWFNHLLISSAHKGQYYTAFTLGDAIRTTLTPLTFSKPAFNGIQWDFLSDKYAVTLLGSRLNSPGVTAQSQGALPGNVENTTRFLGARGVVQVGDFSQVGLTWANAANASSELSLGENSLKGVLTGPQNTGNIETVVIRVSDDSPESPESGALFFFDQVLIDGEPHPEIIPFVKGGIQREGILEAKGPDVIELIYDIRNNFRPTEQVPTFRDAQKLNFELIVANDYRIEVTSNLQTNSQGDLVFLPVSQAWDNITDGSNQKTVWFEYGLPTATEVIGMDLQVRNLSGLDLRAEYAVNRRFHRSPNQNFRKLPPTGEQAEAYYVSTSYVRYPWFAYAEAFNMDPDYSTTAFIGDTRGVIDYDDPQRHLFEFVDDNDDQDRFPDWQRYGQVGEALSVTAGAVGRDLEVFPGLDENNDFVSDFNQNRNNKPDYDEPFLRYAADPPEFLFGMDMNNNTLIDRFEDDREADYPYERDHHGANLYGGLKLSEPIQVTVGHVRERMLSNARRSRATYGLLTAEFNHPGWSINLFEHAKLVKDNIPEDRLRWVDPVGSQDFADPLDYQNTFFNSVYLQAKYSRIRNLQVSGKLKYETFIQRGDQANLKRNRSFVGLINKVNYSFQMGKNFSFSPKWKSIFRHEVPSLRISSKAREITEILTFTGRYSFQPSSWLDLGIEFRDFVNLIERPDEPPPGFVDDFRSLVLAFLFSNTSAYQGYQLTLNVGLQSERQKFKEGTKKEATAFMRVFASTGSE